MACPGHVRLVASRALVAIGRGPRARELLAAVRPADPAYAQSRALLGDIAMLQGDGAGALRWYDAADQADTDCAAAPWPDAAGRCCAAATSSTSRPPRCSWQRWMTAPWPWSRSGARCASIRSRPHRCSRLRYPAPRRARAPRPPRRSGRGARGHGPRARGAGAAGTDSRRCPPRRGRTLHPAGLGRLTDRGRALEFRQRHAASVPGLAIEEGRDPRGQSVYRARTGAWSDPAAAGEAAVELGRKLGLDVIVVDRQAPARPGG